MSSIGSGEKRRVPKKEVLGEILINKLFERDFSKGSQFLYIAGAPGSGKTSLALGIAAKTIRMYPSELCFWRESLLAPVQFTKISKAGIPYQVLVERRFPVVVREISAGRKVSKDISVRYFEGFRQLMDRARGGCLNVVYFREDDKWTDFIRFLVTYPGFQSVFLDELEDITPEFSGGDTWRKNKKFADVIKQIRKGCTQIVADSQNVADCDHRVRKKCTMWAYLHGAVVDSASPVQPRAVQSLGLGGCWLDFSHGEYGQIRFKAFEPISQSYVIEPREDDAKE